MAPIQSSAAFGCGFVPSRVAARLALAVFFAILLACGDSTGPTVNNFELICQAAFDSVRGVRGEPDRIEREVDTEVIPGEDVVVVREWWTYSEYVVRFASSNVEPDRCGIAEAFIGSRVQVTLPERTP